MKTILITGASSGIGLATTKLFLNKNWNVIATMRNPEKFSLDKNENLLVTKLDVLDKESIKSAISSGIEKFGKIDCIVNNAGYGLIGPFEASDDKEIEKQFGTNVFGVFNVTREILPHFRENRAGTIINVTSMGGRLTFPFYSLYHSTKFAVEGFSDSLQFELRDFNIKVKLIEPGPIKTDFYGRSMEIMKKEGLDDYNKMLEFSLPKMSRAGETGASPDIVANKIFQAANDNSFRMRYVPDRSAKLYLFLRKILPDRAWHFVVRRAVLGK